jgi:hypothetical protein
MLCPHCQIAIHDAGAYAAIANYPAATEPSNSAVVLAPNTILSAFHQRCPQCHGEIVFVERWTSPNVPAQKRELYLAYPRAVQRPVPAEVPEPYRGDFVEACLVFADTPKASAALSRRCIQAILRDRAGTKSKDLYDQIEEVIKAGVPSHIAESLHAARNIGNFAAHPMKSTNSGEILDVEPGEAEWNLDVLDALADFYFVQPSITAKRKVELNKKLREAGKP